MRAGLLTGLARPSGPLVPGCTAGVIVDAVIAHLREARSSLDGTLRGRDSDDTPDVLAFFLHLGPGNLEMEDVGRLFDGGLNELAVEDVNAGLLLLDDTELDESGAALDVEPLHALNLCFIAEKLEKGLGERGREGQPTETVEPRLVALLPDLGDDVGMKGRGDVSTVGLVVAGLRVGVGGDGPLLDVLLVELDVVGVIGPCVSLEGLALQRLSLGPPTASNVLYCWLSDENVGILWRIASTAFLSAGSL